MTEIEKAIDVVRLLVIEKNRLKLERNNLQKQVMESEHLKDRVQELEEENITLKHQVRLLCNEDEEKENKELTPEEAWGVVRNFRSDRALSGVGCSLLQTVAAKVDDIGSWASEPFLEWKHNDCNLCRAFLDMIFNYKEEDETY